MIGEATVIGEATLIGEATGVERVEKKTTETPATIITRAAPAIMDNPTRSLRRSVIKDESKLFERLQVDCDLFQ